MRLNSVPVIGLFLLASATPAHLQAQESRFSTTKLRRHVETLADDSMLGRPTPSASLEKAAQYVARELAAMGLTPWDSTFFNRYPVPDTIPRDSATTEMAEPVKPANVVAMLRGSDPALRDELVVITAHLDGVGMLQGSVLNGADDNASGVAALLEIARALADDGQPPRRSVLLAAVTGEEPGLWGSEYLVSRLSRRPGRVAANLNMDMVGRARGDSVVLVATRDQRTERLVAETRQAHDDWGFHLLGREALAELYPGENLEQRSDHANFVRRGIPAVVLFTGLHEDYHRPGDDANKINYEALARIARMAYDITVALADARE